MTIWNFMEGRFEEYVEWKRYVPDYWITTAQWEEIHRLEAEEQERKKAEQAKRGQK